MDMTKLYESSQIALEYIKYRPAYQKGLSDSVLNYLNHQEEHSSGNKFDLMVDVGCGSGQSTNIFQSYFKKIIGIDISLEQLKHAESQNKFDNIEYLHGNAENIPVDDNSVDLLASGVAAHWFDMPKFCEEAKRVLKKNGCLAIYGYSRPTISLLSDNDETSWEKPTKLFEALITKAATTNIESLMKDLIVGHRYVDVFEAIPFTTKERDDTIHMVEAVSINDVCGWFRSVHFYEIYMNKQIEELKAANIEVTQERLDSFDIALQLKKELIQFWNLKDVSPDEKVVRADYSLFLLLARTS